MANTSVLYARIDSDLKTNAEEILQKLGITPTSAIQMLYSQIVLTQSMPLSLRLPPNPPIAMGSLTREELDKEIAKGNIIYDFHVYGNRYAYLKDEILSNEDRVFEMYYTMFEDWEEMVSDLKTIYIFPTDLEKTKEKLKDRMLSKEEEAYRISEMQKQYNTVVNNREILDKYDHIFYNDYTEQATKDLLNIVRKMQAEQGGNCINKED